MMTDRIIKAIDENRINQNNISIAEIRKLAGKSNTDIYGWNILKTTEELDCYLFKYGRMVTKQWGKIVPNLCQSFKNTSQIDDIDFPSSSISAPRRKTNETLSFNITDPKGARLCRMTVSHRLVVNALKERLSHDANKVKTIISNLFNTLTKEDFKTPIENVIERRKVISYSVYKYDLPFFINEINPDNTDKHISKILANRAKVSVQLPLTEAKGIKLFRVKTVQITDYACGQGLATGLLFDYLPQLKNKVTNITLIEPSYVALTRAKAILNVMCQKIR